MIRSKIHRLFKPYLRLLLGDNMAAVVGRASVYCPLVKTLLVMLLFLIA